MSWRTVVITSSAKLGYQLGFLVIRKEDIIKINLSEIAILILESTAVSMTAALLCELSKKKIKVIFCDTKRNPYGELMPYYGSHDSSAKIRQQIEWKKDIKTAVWTEIVSEKIRKPEQFEHCEKMEVLKFLQYEVVIAGRKEMVSNAIKIYCHSVFDAINDMNTSLIKFYRNEL